MSLDFHLADTREAARKSSPRFAIGAQEHGEFFYKNKKPVTMPTFLQRISDYYKDAVFKNYELPNFLAELKTAKAQATTEFQIKLLDDLMILCQDAIENELSIFAFCD